ncbi:MAG: peptidase inhibitor I78 [Proteobacteria bacterium]|nr:peptidase inhibitor I78 [Pseudomonadota bacterium]
MEAAGARLGEAGVRPRVAAAVLALGLAGCASPDYPTSAPSETPAPAPSAPPPAVSPPPAPRLASPVPRSQPQYPPQTAARDACGAADMQGMVGKSRTLIPVPVDPNRQRVACTTCKLSDDTDPGRLNFLFNAHTGLIEQVRCG